MASLIEENEVYSRVSGLEINTVKDLRDNGYYLDLSVPGRPVWVKGQ